MNSVHFASASVINQKQVYLQVLSINAAPAEAPKQIEISRATNELVLNQVKHGTFGKAFGEWRTTIDGDAFTMTRWVEYPYHQWDPSLQKTYRYLNEIRIKNWAKIVKEGQDFFQQTARSGVIYSAKETQNQAKEILNLLKDVHHHPPMSLYYYFKDIEIVNNGLFQSSINQAIIKSPLEAKLDWLKISMNLKAIKEANLKIYQLFCELSSTSMV